MKSGPKSIAMLTIASLFVAMTTTALWAATSEWTVSEGGRIRLAALAPQPDGSVEAVLEIETLPGWKTYWRDPGASGLAPELDFSASQNLTLEHVGFPVPSHIGTGDASFVGFKQPIGLSLSFRQPFPGQRSVLAANVLVGICDKICIPVSASYQLELTPGEQPDAMDFGAVKLAEAMLPERPAPDFGVASARVDEGGKILTLALMLPDRISPELHLAPPSGFVIGPMGDVKLTNGQTVVELPILRSPKGKSLSGQKIVLLVKSGARAMETTLVPD